MVRHRAFLPGLLALVAALLLESRTTPRTELAPPFHGIARAERSEVARLREVWSRSHPGDPKRKTDELRRRAVALGEPASRALLQMLVEHYASSSMDSWCEADRDETEEPEGMLIGELATDETAHVLARAVLDRGLASGLRRALIVALCRPRFAFAADTLADIACDRRDEHKIREAILCRYERLGCRAPESFLDLLYQPYHGLDVFAAATLAICGEPEAPSLVLEGLTVPGSDYAEQELAHCAEAVHRITGKPLTFSHSYPINGTGREAEKAASLARVAAHVEALEGWMAEHPAESAFERRRREYLAGDARRREMRVKTVEDMPAGHDFDLAAVSLWLTEDRPDLVTGSLEKLDRLAFLCGRRLEGARDIEARVEVLNGLLAQVPVRVRDYHDPRWASRLPSVLWRDDGNCVARSMLYLAVAERLRLPLRAYFLPQHVYVAWVEGGICRNIETTDEGRERPGNGMPVSRRGVLSMRLSNDAGTFLDLESFAEAQRCAEEALALDPGNHAALCVRALARWQTDLDFDPRPDLDRVEEIPSVPLAAAEIAWKLDFPEDALRRAEETYRREPSPDAAAMQARAYLALGDTERARKVADEAAARWPDAGGALAFVRFEMALDEDLAALDRTDISPLWKARALLDRGLPARALAQLDAARERFLGERKTRFEGNTIHAVDQGERATARREFRLLETRALAKLGRAEEAREALRAAEEAAPADRETLEVRRLLAGG